MNGRCRYTTSFMIMIGLLVIGFVCNELIKPVNPRFHEPDAATAAEKKEAAA